ncbi:MAG: glucosaminidase domain-containing protein [Bacteroidota bacterium]
MWKRPVFIFLALLVGWQIFGQQSDREAYIEKYKDIAIAEMERAGVPASIKLAQGLLESGAGTSTLAKRANNHFGMKCGARWEGKTFYREDDDYDENGKLIKSCFRVYRNADASFVAHSEFLRDPNKNFRYGFLFRLNPRDYKAWARGLKKAGYATSPTYATNLINIIERYQLYRYDRMLPGTIEDTGPPEDLALGIQRVNDVKLVLAVANETPADIALRTGVSISRILKYNERINDPNQALRKNERVYLQRKRSSYRGQKKFHFVRAGETMFSIAQRYGLRLDKLYRKNRMEEGSEPAAGSQLKIRGWTRVKKAPALRSEVIPEGDPESPELEWEEELETEAPGFEIDFNEPVIEIEEEEAGGAELYHEVIKGETLFGLARRYGTTVEEIKTLNRLDSNIISVGQRLRVK